MIIRIKNYLINSDNVCSIKNTGKTIAFSMASTEKIEVDFTDNESANSVFEDIFETFQANPRTAYFKQGE